MAEGSRKYLRTFAEPDNLENLSKAAKWMQYAKACKNKGILAGVPCHKEIGIILGKYKDGIPKQLESVKKQRKVLDEHWEGLMIQADALAQLEKTVKGMPFEPVAKVLGAMGGFSDMDILSSAKAPASASSVATTKTTNQDQDYLVHQLPDIPQTPTSPQSL